MFKITGCAVVNFEAKVFGIVQLFILEISTYCTHTKLRKCFAIDIAVLFKT